MTRKERDLLSGLIGAICLIGAMTAASLYWPDTFNPIPGPASLDRPRNPGID